MPGDCIPGTFSPKLEANVEETYLHSLYAQDDGLSLVPLSEVGMCHLHSRLPSLMSFPVWAIYHFNK